MNSSIQNLNEIKIVAIIQARMGSTRLPGKVLLPLAEKPVIWHVVTRVKACPRVNEVVVATTTTRKDEPLLKECKKFLFSVFRGSEEDVLSRYFQAAKSLGADVIIRVTSDCPVIDPVLLDAMLKIFLEKKLKGEKIDYLSNTQKRSFPRGLDIEIFSFEALEMAQLKAIKRADREHVTPYLYQHPDNFVCQGYEQEFDRSANRWTLDTQEDYVLLKEIFSALYQDGQIFTTNQILDFLKNRPDLVAINAHIEQKKLHD